MSTSAWTEFLRALVCLPPSRGNGSTTRYTYTTRSSHRPSHVKPYKHHGHHYHSSSSGGTTSTTTKRYVSKERTRPRTRTVDSGYSEGVVDFGSSRK